MWRGEVADRIRKGKLPITLEKLDRMDARDMRDDVRAHSIRRKTHEQGEAIRRAFEKIPVAQVRGVLTWYNFLALEAGETGCEEIEDMFVDISFRRKEADKYICGLSIICKFSLARHVLDWSGHVFGRGET